MARDRRRAKQRRDRQARAGGTQARRVDGPVAPDPTTGADRTHEPADPPELASGERDLADAHLALGRPELTDAGVPLPPADQMDAAGTAEIQDEAEFEALEDRVDDAEEAFEEGAVSGDDAVGGADEGGAVATRSRRRAPAQAAEQREGNRLMTFLRGSWRELQRVQWPDRRQVGQATAVTIGFVIVAGAFLGAADFVAGKIVEFII
jgi:preprotein translocase subunit SecE